MNIRRMFFGGNTADGFHSFHEYVIGPNRKRFYILKGMPGGGKSSLMKKIGIYFKDKGYGVEFHHCPSDPESIDSILIEELGVAIADGTAPHVMDPIYPGLKDRIIDLVQYIDSDKLNKDEDRIIKAKEENKKAYTRAFSYLRAARNIYDLIVKNNSKGVDFEGLNKRTLSLVEEIFSVEAKEYKSSPFQERHGFSTANTPAGFVDYTDTLLEGIGRIYYMDSDIGTGKSTLIKRILYECQMRDYNVEVYHNSTFPEKIETLIIKDLNTCITSNVKGRDFPHILIDLRKYFDEKVKNTADYDMYYLLMKKAYESLAEAKKNHAILEKIYVPTVDYSKIDEVREKILEEIVELANS